MSESHHPPGLPEVVDEAADTPAWVPLSGLLLLAFLAVLFVISQATGDGEQADGQQPAAEQIDEP